MRRRSVLNVVVWSVVLVIPGRPWWVVPFVVWVVVTSAGVAVGLDDEQGGRLMGLSFVMLGVALVAGWLWRVV